MRLHEIKHTYDAVYSLGSNCYPSQRMERCGLRPYSGVVDWMYSNSVPGLCALLRNRFAMFMDPANTIVEEDVLNGHNYFLLDRAYGIQSVHDFTCKDGRTGIHTAYPPFQAKMKRRIARFLHKAERSKHIFFFRLNASYEEAMELEAALASIVRHQFTLLVVNPGESNQIIECDWPLSRTCALQLPIGWDAKCDELWNTVLAGIVYQGEEEYVTHS
ncbi:DUF1796 family putative cysteine peptidase [Paenibacillus alvei]|uniref:Peptidase n=1 Tax=Paenibacillus alvei TaxID=44250 RepID=A0AAP7DHA3_PAEAL|nr:DUF1796 family putative cysteine peptidase [Paenibacillus alvei]MBG9736815.1 peptidase [Paenibacillus alvei]MBG9746971.1 peptidase [Paenibacillus alvei]MCY9581998.1 papain-like cysteine peptidase [Paenibacillus alvei]MCY9585896.1 papain-like cysteine peptidase [Paenibacillus alvei]NEZ43533.1 peptidase [Paenibacillus alvei]